MAAPAHAHVVGRLPGSQQLNLALTLILRNEAQLDTLLQQIYDPSSPNYRHFLTVEQFAAQFGPTPDDYAKAIAFAQSHGLTIANTAPNRLVLDVRGAASNIEQAFRVKMQVYRHPTENRTFYAPDVEPSIDAGIPIQGVNGLNDFAPPRPMLKFAPAGSVRPNQTGSGPGGQFLGSDMRAAYYGGTALTGAGQAIGLFEFAPYNLSDVQAYFTSIDQPLNVPIVNVLLDGISPICGTCNDGEQVIDIQQAISMAPGLSAVIVYEGTNDTDMFNQMAVDNIAKQLSCSWGWLPPDPKSDEPIFLEFAAQGQNLFVASGDSGAYTLPGCSGNDCNPAFYPEDDPLITAAGGTHITTNGPGGPWESEIAWGGNPVLACGYPTGGSSGGYSTNGFPIPGYQQLKGVITSSNDGSTTLRNVPDVAAEADCDNWYCADGSCQGGVGGTSLAAPRWAGFLALANEQANGVPIGFLNPVFYAIGTAASYGSHFHDITSGSNNNGLGETYNAVAGYDLVTGWGSPNGQDLINVMGPVPTGPNFALTATPGTLNVTQGNTGTSSITLTALSGFTGTVNLTVAAPGQPAGVTPSLNPATVTASSPAMLSVATTTATPGGNFPIVVTGTASGLTQTAYVTLALPGFSLTAPANIFLNQGGSTAGAITVSAVNGFSGSVTFSVSGLPQGVKVAFSQGSSTGSTELFLSATNQAALGYANLTVVGTSGDLTQSANINLAVSAATGTGGSGTPADLSAAYNVFGIYNNGVTYTTGGMDGDGYSYSEKLLTPSRIAYGTQFNFGPANHADAVSGTGQPIALPAGKFSRLSLLATGVNGSQTDQAITVTYTDGSTSEFTRSFSDWFTPSDFPGESEAVAMPYRNVSNGGQDDRTFNLYGYPIPLDNTKTVQSLTLPDNRNLVVLAATLTQ
ncbi:MAG TPA: protease pro-enzyme activation domain-containing protein [Bryobacteraceae bacterium]|nr:protease pro-enzyme activation domain-containing protein [Bryobacteraceae bacterium]